MDLYHSSTTPYHEVERNTTVERLPRTERVCFFCDGAGRTNSRRDCSPCRGTGTLTEGTRMKVTYRAMLPDDAPKGADPESMPLAIDGLELGAYEMRLLALQLWRASFVTEAIPATPGAEWRSDRAIRARNALVERSLSTAESIMDERWYERTTDSDDSAWDNYAERVVQIATTDHMGNLHVSQFMAAMSDGRQAGAETLEAE